MSISGGSSLLASSSVELVRPADANAYAAKDAVANSTSAPVPLTFANMTPGSGRVCYLTRAMLLTDQKTFTGRLRLHLFSAAPTAVNDNAPMTLLYANAANYQGWVDLPAAASEDPTNSTAAVALAVGSGNLPLPCVSGADANLYGLLEALDAFTPASGQKFTIRLDGDAS